MEGCFLILYSENHVVLRVTIRIIRLFAQHDLRAAFGIRFIQGGGESSNAFQSHSACVCVCESIAR